MRRASSVLPVLTASRRALTLLVLVSLIALSGCGGSGGNTACDGHPCVGDWQKEQSEGGTVVQCGDGTWSHAGGIQGACSHHGGEQ